MYETDLNAHQLTSDLYRAVSGPAGRRDWSLARPYFHDDARLVRTGLDAHGRPFQQVMTWDAYTADADRTLASVGFWEEEVEQRVLRFGDVAQIRSVYQFIFDEPTGTRTGRGLNLLSLVCFEGRWRIMSLIWGNVRPGLTLDTLDEVVGVAPAGADLLERIAE